ncbi:MAG TPA: hypothetical protein VK889_09215 [Solirubrobacterales bacterium]|nr:hypothetical protein [Solirubrobacterales bacterium]
MITGPGKLPRYLFVLTAAAAILVPQVVSTTAASGRQVYRAERPAITVSLTKEGRYLRNIRVEARGECTNGDRKRISFAIIGSGRLEIAGNGRFNTSRRNAHELRTLKGRVEGDLIRGYFRRFYDGSAANGFEPRCGTGGPYSRRIYFVAR